MTNRHASKLTRAQRRELNKKSRQLRQTKQRRMQYEPLEARQLLAADFSPQLVSIQPNTGELLEENDVRGISPRSLTFNFAEVGDAGDLIDPTSVADGIVIFRAGLDGKLGTSDDVKITGPGSNFEGFIGIGDQPSQVVVRFGEALPDDIYRIQVTSALKDIDGDSAKAFTRNFELNLAPQVMSVVPQPVTRNQDTGKLEIARDMIYVYFNDDDLDPTLANNPDYYQLTFQYADNDSSTASNNDLGLGNDSQSFYPESVTYDPETDLAMLKFSEPIETLIDASDSNAGYATVFRLQIGVRGIASKGSQILDTTTLNDGTDAGSSFETAFNLSDLATSVDLQSSDGLESYAPGTNLFAGNSEFRVTRGDLASVNHTTFTINDGLGNLRTFELTSDGTATTGNIKIDISSLNGTTTALAAAIRAAIIDESDNSGGTFNVTASTVTGFSADRSQLRGTQDNRVSMVLGNKTTGLIVDNTQALVIRGKIQNTNPYDIALPGGNDEPGHRDIEIGGENHLDGQDTNGMGVTILTYNFPEIYGVDPASSTGELLHNQITEAQKQRAREIFEIYSFYSGITFIEVPNGIVANLGVVTGDLRALDPEIPTGPGGAAGLAGSGLAIMETADHDQPGDDEVGSRWQWTAFHEIGHLLGLDHTYDLPIGTNMGQDENNLDFGQNVERLLPGDFDITHLQHLYRPDVIDIDLYRFDVTERGTLSAEIVAERLNDSSRLDAALTLYRRNGDGSYTAIARNNDYFSEDPFMELELEPGTYYVGVSASGNDVYDPNIEDSGFGGTSQGEYELQLRFSPTVNDSLRDTGSTVAQLNSIVVQADGSGFVDGSTITLKDGSNIDRIFEFDTDGQLSSNNHIAVPILATSLQSEIVAALVNAVNAVDFGVDATSTGNVIKFSGLAANSPITLSPEIIQKQAIVVTSGAAAGAALDGDLDGIAGGNYNFWFRAEPSTYDTLASNAPRTLFVDATYTDVVSTGSINQPFKTIAAAIAAAKSANRGDVIRVIGLPGINDKSETLEDNIAYLIGRDPLTNAPLRDGTDIVIPKGVTLMIDEGAILKFNNASIQVGSTSVTDDRSFAALQILGIPERYQPRTDDSGNIIETSIDSERVDRRVTLTSYRETKLLNDPDAELVGNASYLQGDASPGNWGGILFNQEVDREQFRGTYSDSGIFLNSIIGAEFRYAGGITEVDGADISLAPIYLEESRPTINYNVIRLSAGAALSADPNSFEESNYTVYKGAPAAFTPDIKRVGPDIFGNRVVNNSTNGMLVRVSSSPGQPIEEMTVTGRFDDTDMVYVIQEALHIDSTPGGAYSDMNDAIKVSHLSDIEAGSYLRFIALSDTGPYDYRTMVIQFVKSGQGQTITEGDAYFNPYFDPSDNNSPVWLAYNKVFTIDLDSDLALNYTESYLAELIAGYINEFRDGQAFVDNGYFLNIDAETKNSIITMQGGFDATFFDVNGLPLTGQSINVEPVYVARFDASLVVDPNVVVKFNAGRIEVEMGANFIAEGAPGRPVVFTSLHDDRYGFGGTFDTNNNGEATLPSEGDWSGIYFAHASSGSIDQALIAYGGGESGVAGGQAEFNAVEIHQAVVRITNSTFEYNADGYDETGQNAGGATRNGHMSNDNAVIFMRDSQSVVVGNNFRYNSANVLSVDTSSLSYDLIVDWGRSTGNLDAQRGLGDNQGALIRRNLLTDNDLNAMVVRGGVLTTQSVWDDTDIVHVVYDTIYSTNFHTYGGIRIESSATESLVVKLFGDNAGFVATGTQLDIDDRIGGMLHVVGQAGFPVIFTDFRDDTVGAGFDQFGKAQTDTNNDGNATKPLPGAWKGLTIEQFANDRNVQVVVEAEANNLTGKGINGSPLTSQYLGHLAPDEYGGNETQRLGYEVNGYLSNTADVDVYSFVAQPGTEVWFDIDKTSYYLDVVVELIDGDGNVLAASSNSYDQSGDSFYGQSGLLSVTNPLQKSGFYDEDLWSNNPRDAGFRVVLPGQAGTARTYHVRVRSNSDNLTSVDGNVMAGTTSGVYQLNVRLREVDELAGSSIQFADIRYAENGISIYGQPGHSPVLGESSENGNNNDTAGNAQKLGNVLNSDRGAISVAGELDNLSGLDVDWYEVNFDFDSIQSIGGTSAASEYGSLVIDLDYAAGFDNANTIVSVYDSSGRLIFISDRGAVNDDLLNPQTPGSAGLADQSRGSASTADPYLGTIMLPAGTPDNPITYYVAVSSQAQTSVQMDQFFSANAANTLVRLEPINSVRRIVEDHLDGVEYYSTPTAPDSTSIINTDDTSENVSPYVLGDFTLFLSTDAGTETSDLYAVDPFTGAIETYIGRAGRAYDDMAMSPDGKLYAYRVDEVSQIRDSESGDFLLIDTGNGSYSTVTSSIIGTYTSNNAGNNSVLDNWQTPGNDGSGIGWGYQFQAATFQNNGNNIFGLNLYAVGNRGGVTNSTHPQANILFEMDASDLNGDSSNIGMPENTRPINIGIVTDGDTSETNIRTDHTARINTGIDVNPNGSINAMVATRATVGNSQASLLDGMYYFVDPDGPGGAPPVAFELDLGNDFRLNLNPGGAGNRYIRDGMSFEMEGSTPETIRFQTGGVINTTNFNAALVDNTNNPAAKSFITISDGLVTRRFVFDNVDNGQLTLAANEVRVPFTSTSTSADIRTELINAINVASNGLNVTANGTIANRISLVGDTSALISGNIGGIQIEGTYDQTSSAGDIVVNVEEFWSSSQVANAIQAAVADANANGFTNLQVSVSGERFNFLEAGTSVGYNQVNNAFDALLNPAYSATKGVTAGRVPVYIGAGFTDIQVANAVTAAAVGEGLVASNTVGTANSSVITFGPNASITTNTTFDTPFNTGGNATNGLVTGMAWIGESIYAVTDTGGLWLLNPGGNLGLGGDEVPADFITSITDENGNALNFQSLTAGPSRTSGGVTNTAYSSVLFGVTNNGDIYAFDANGAAQFVFQGNKSHLSTGIGGARGLQFGTLNENLWHVTGNREQNSAGHGVSVPVDNTRNAQSGGSSLYFGNQYDAIGVNGNSQGNATTNDYNFPGDAHGTVITDPFSLYGYNASDMPTLYFTYLLDTEDQDFDYGPNPDMPATDAFRVFIAGDDGDWQLLATNNTLRQSDTGNNPDDEFDTIGNASSAAVDEALRADRQNGTEGVQAMFDNTGWRQARIDLGVFAGQENLRLRFDFSTGGSVNLGGYHSTTGNNLNTEELRVLKGSKMADGGTFTANDYIYNQSADFEFNKGQSFIFDSAGRVADALNPLAAPDKNTFTLVAAAAGNPSFTFEYVLNAVDAAAGNVPIVFSLNDSASEIRQKTQAAILGAFGANGGVSIYDEAPDTFNIQGILDLDQADAAFGMTVIGSSATTPGIAVINYNSETTAEELAEEAQRVMNLTMAPQAYAQGYEMFTRFQEFIYGNGYSFDTNDSGLGHDEFLQGDDFGYASEARVGREDAANSNAKQRGQDNLHRGVFFDDIIIGFAERGEMVTNATTNNAFIHNDDLRENELVTGEYQLEIRRGTDYAAPELAELFGLDRFDLWMTPGFDFDTNDRLDESYTIRTASGDVIGNGDRIRVSDGTNWVTFEFFDLDSVTERQKRGLAGTGTRTAYDANNNIYSIGFYNTDSDSQVAARLMNAINDRSGQVARGLINTTNTGLGVYAQMNSRSGTTTSNRVDLSPATTSDVVVVEYDVRSDDSIREAYSLDLRGDLVTAGTYAERDIWGIIGDNDSVNKMDGIADVDVYKFSLVKDQMVEFRLATAFANTIGVEGMLRLFVQNANGTFSEVAMTLLEGATEDVYSYTAAATGNYFVSIAANPAPLPANGGQAAASLGYDPTKVPKNDAGRQVKTYEGQYFINMRVADNLDTAVQNANMYLAVNRIANPETDDNVRLFTNPITGETNESIDIIRYDSWVTNILGYNYEFKAEGDSNRRRDQGQIIISSNIISNSENYGILVDAGDRLTVEDQESDNNRPHQGPPLNVPSAANTRRLATGVTITNNVVFFDAKDSSNNALSNSGAILYSGDAQGGSLGAVPFGRIVNNTLYGTGNGDVGVRVEEAAGPTLMNNIIAKFATGIQVADATSKANTVISRTLFKDNGANSPDVGTGSLPVILGTDDPLFVDAAGRNFYLAEGSQAIDSAVDAIQERPEVSQVVNPLGIDSTPILAPERDITGQLRVDDPNVVSSGGVGGVTFRDIGAFDRADFTGPTGYLFDPQDNDAENKDLDKTPDIVQWISGPLTNISIQLLDEGEISNQVQGTGVDDSTVSTKSVTLEIVSSGQSVVLQDGIDYQFDYDATNNIIRLVPISGVFQQGVLYKVTLDSDPNSEYVIRDVANNPIEFNNQVDDGKGNPVGETRFLIQAGGLVDFGDAPDTYGTLLESDGARHNLVDNFYLGSSVDAEIDGQPTADASGDGSTDDGIFIRTPDPNNAGSYLNYTLRDNITNEIYITATVPSGSKAYGFVDAWIDFNHNGNFDDPGEQILVSRALTIDAINPAGSASGLGQLIKISDLPEDFQIGDTIARFRYSSTGGLSSTGLAADGEVEDYQVTIGAPAVNPWHNSSKPLAITKGDSSVTGLDLNYLVSEMRNRVYTYGPNDVPAGKAVGDFRPAYDPDTIDPAMVPAYLDVNNDRKVTSDDLALLLNYFTTASTVSPEPLDGEMIQTSMISGESTTGNLASPIAVESHEIVASISSPVTPATSPTTTSLQTDSLVGSSSFMAFAPTYSELQMRPAAELMGLSTVSISESQFAVESYVDEAIALDELCEDDHFGQLIGDMADDLSATWDAKNFSDDTENADSSEDDLDELLTLLSSDSSSDG
ncbi:hypothetical protein DTL42_20120 [Bremerella cremea]|uniref:GEVED domain-containing protein n=1 Tax=Bremerella cremea TaxID=1031537 RepID=A0A368KLT9_9BACT|nr:GEVED domain-containing protein [Bremerella cremea]RCS42139.1 hypothetical protein DTL42_20120 [Bremerella cremea]